MFNRMNRIDRFFFHGPQQTGLAFVVFSKLSQSRQRGSSAKFAKGERGKEPNVGMRVIQGGHKRGGTTPIETRTMTTDDMLRHAVTNPLSRLGSYCGRSLGVD